MRFMKNFCFLAVMAWGLWGLAASAAAMTFSADLYSSDGHNGKIYMDTDKIRVETKEMISITRQDKKLIWLLMPEEKMYMEQVLHSAAMNQKHLPANDSGASDVEREFIFRETINGYGADKYKITINKQSSYYEWVSSDPGITMAVKTAAIDGSWWTEYRNISLGNLNPSLFEVPADYTKMSMSGMGGFIPRE